MAITANHFISAILMLIIVSPDFSVAQIGVCFGRLANGLPSASEVVAMYKQHNIQKMRIFDPYPPVLQALSGSDIELTVGVANEDLKSVAASQYNADTWVKNNIRKYPNVRFTHVVVGNEISPIRDTSQYVPFVLPAMQKIYNAIRAAGLGNKIKVSTCIDTGVLEKSYPPQDGVFRSDVTPYLNPIIQFLMKTNAPIFVCIYPYFAYINDKKHINLSYALLQPNSGINAGGVMYDNLFYAIVDAMYAAMERSIYGSSLEQSSDARRRKTPELIGSETGWSTPPGGDIVMSVEKARIYNTNLMRIVKKGTPKRPGQPIQAYIFAMFDEDQKPGNEHERHFGIFRPNGQPKYRINFN